MSSLRKSLLSDQFSILLGNSKKNIEKLDVKGGKNQDLQSIEKLCEDAEASLNALKEYEPVNNQERREQALALNTLSQLFEQSLSQIASLSSSNQIQLFSDLQEDVLKSRKDHLQVLEKKLGTVHEIMKECSDIVIVQGKSLDRIDSEMSIADENTKKAKDQLIIASKKQKYKRYCCVTVLIVTSLVLIGIIVLSFLLGQI
ncbi:hypothetical protein SteCoe_20134 [Stentor coeruleus]|uniref:t-SNARE coiled-coil homology domain-containing protein n=1 Tax=Stentor coeruleus TaxID=5963 RepID=A0A1R2BSQ4_9CILI|nr:hypothetical protein SteCoe_20134 [Stentor coeruleus]